MEIQDFLIAALQNITILITRSEDKISNSNTQRGWIIRAQRAKWEGFSSGLSPMRLFAQFTMDLGIG